MKQEIRERIEKIRKGEVPEGYKKTKVGIIPVDWEVKKLEDVSPLQRGFDLTSNELKNGDYPVVYSNGIVNYHCSYKVKAPGVVTGRSGTIGKVTFVEEDYWPHNTSLWVTNFKGNDPKFIYYLYLQIKLERFGAGSGVPTLNRNDVHSFKIPFPLLLEQPKIADILSTWDKAIELKEKLITEKKEFKRGLMQKLLTGELRFPEFTGDWEEKKIGIICEIKKGIQINKTELSIKGKYGVLNGGISPSGYTTEWNTKENTITISEGGNSCGFVNFNKDKFWCGGHCYALTNVKINNLLLYYILKYEEKKIMQLRVGSGLPNIQKKDLIKFILLIPKNVDEQEKIAKILHLISIEIMTLIKELNQLKEQKIGLVQLLFTGIVRVEVD